MKNLPVRTLVIIRHAHRNKDLGGDADNGISAKGKAQARNLAQYFKKRFKNQKAWICSSPRKRCQQTVSRIAGNAGVELELLDCLDESSTLDEIKRKAQEFDRLWRAASSELTVICSHGDWIPVFLKRALGFEIDLEKGGCAELLDDASGCRLHGLNQSLDWL